MSIEELINCFTLYKKEKPLNVNDLLDYVQLMYIQGQLSLPQYRNLFQELHERGAEKPIYYIDDLNLELL